MVFEVKKAKVLETQNLELLGRQIRQKFLYFPSAIKDN